MEILDPNFTGAVKIEYNPCVICLENVNIAVDFNTPCESETSESSNYFTNDTNESLLKLLTMDIDLPNVSSSRSKNMFLNSHGDNDNDNAVSQEFRNSNEENHERLTIGEKEKHERKENKAHFYCDICFVRNKEILRIYNEIESLHKTFKCLRDAIEGAFKGGCIDDGEPFLGDSDGAVYWRTLRQQFAQSFKLVVPEENCIKNQDVFDYCESPRITSPTPNSPNSDFDADGSINIQHSHPRRTPDPQGSAENCIVTLGTTSTTTLPTFSLFPPSKASTSTSNSKISNSTLKDVVISIRKLPDHIRPNIPVLINHGQTYPADLHRQQPVRKILKPKPSETESFRLRPTRNCFRNRAVQSYNDHQGFLDSKIGLSDSDVTEKHETEVNLSDVQKFDVDEDIHPPKEKRKPSNTKKEEKKTDACSSSLTLKSKPKPPRFFCTVKGCKRRKVFSSLESLDIHTKESHEDMSHPFKCPKPECERSFRKFRDYKTHIDTTHNKKYKFICHHCGKGFGISNNLQSHLGVHTTESLYKCPDCPKALRSRANLIIHRRSVHTGERHQCHICGKSFVRASKLKNHILCIHFDDRPYSCKLCAKNFPIQGYLYMHMRNTHGKVKPLGDPDPDAAADLEKPQQSKLGARKSEQIISKSTTTVMLPEDCENPERIPHRPPHFKETPVAPFYSPPLPLLPLVAERHDQFRLQPQPQPQFQLQLQLPTPTPAPAIPPT